MGDEAMQIYRAVAAAAFTTVLMGAVAVQAQEHDTDRLGTQDKRMPGTMENERPGTINEPAPAMLPRDRKPGTIGRDDAKQEVKPLEQRRRDLEGRDEVEDDMEAAGGEKAPAPNPYRMEGQGGGKKG